MLPSVVLPGVAGGERHARLWAGPSSVAEGGASTMDGGPMAEAGISSRSASGGAGGGRTKVDGSGDMCRGSVL